MLVCCMMIINTIRSNKVTFSWRISIRITTILGRNYRLPFWYMQNLLVSCTGRSREYQLHTERIFVFLA